MLAERVLDRRAAGLGEVGRPDAAERVQVRVVEQRDHRDRRADEAGGEVREPVERVDLLAAEQAGGAQRGDPRGVSQRVLCARAGHTAPIGSPIRRVEGR